ncbi:acetate--CoA ligase family protein [Thermocrispum sp.]|mgnify:CR=1 FL=1|jgi:acetyltransferase|uniref:Acetate--CoA ligase family protein n=2 Tax=Thermocrispum agreste TaxID=37925 RepID=A0ABD6FH96_9PSEU|nr:acetate--CoA ligase family protein [Thermocrispum sp.]
MLNAVFEPSRIALVGASDRPGSAGKMFWDNLRSFPGDVIPVNPRAPTVGGVPTVPSLRNVRADLAVLVTPADTVPEIVAEATGVTAAVVISGGFAEAGPAGVRRQERLMAAARRAGVRIVGPNCFGVQNCALPMNASLSGGLAAPGRISLVTQSGSYGMAVHTVGVDDAAGFAKVCATGNKADVADAELLRYLGADPQTRTICVLSESMPDGREFATAAREITPHKPVVVALTGRSPSGARAAFSHTAALAGRHRIAVAALEDAGVIVARSGLEMLDTARALDHRPLPAGRRVGVVTNSGGTGVELTDLLSAAGAQVPEFSAKLRDELAAVLPQLGSPRNPVDVTTAWDRFPELYRAVVDRLARSGEVDAIVAVLLQRAASPEVAAAVRAAAARSDVPVYVCWVASRGQRAGVQQLADVPCFDWPERTARAVGHAVGRPLPRHAMPAVTSRRRTPPGRLPVDAGARLLAEAGLDVLAWRLCDTPAQAVAAARELGHPVAVKVVHPALEHKSDRGGVRLDLSDEGAVAEAAVDLLALEAGARLLVQRMGTGVEIVVGGIRDPWFGPAIMVGFGGVLADVLDDVAFALAPLDESDAHRLLRRLRGYPVLTGVRGRPPADLDALARTVVAASELLASDAGIAEFDLNPVLCGRTGCWIADWRIKGGIPSRGDRPGMTDLALQGGEMPRGSP